MEGKVLEVIGLTCGYDRRFFLKDITFNVEGGEFLGIIGPNGSGKTTLLRAMTKVLRPEKGEVILEEKDLDRYGYKELAQRIAVVSQYTDSFGLNLTVREYVLLGRTPFRRQFQFLETKRDKEITQQALAVTGVLNLAQRPIAEISGGERQCVIIARALAQEPQLLLLDEPTTHLDIGHQVKILDLIRRLNKERHLTVIIVLHDLNLASEYCERLMLLKEGRIYRMGSPKEVLTYSIIEEVYGTLVVVEESPVSSKPLVCLVPEDVSKAIGDGFEGQK